ncbi:MAG TPA: pyruvate, water dikinase regulatory protein [Alphaproteobacteria bacterium]|nr:phosphoenolpyruvate synthase regulatory protein [Rhodospirillaceae bacterium]HRJ66302.1 pyruvate, water dikinase regulatory protein [Alphaproteobacteria bacterium]
MTKFHLHLISDSTGGTLNSVVKACLAQFEGVETEQHFWPLIRSQRQLPAVLEGIRQNPGLVLYTLVDEGLAKTLEKHCLAMGVRTLSILHPVLDLMSHSFGMQSRAEPGLQHQLNEEYFARMDAVDYALHHDDGQKSDRDLGKADVILVGVSRTSKTPTCIYLANRGVKAANVPYVPGVPFPERVLDLKTPLFVALTASPDRLIDIRRNRLKQLGERRETDYLEPAHVEAEVAEARKFYNRMGWPVIDVTRRSVEETAAEILSLLDHHREALASNSGKETTQQEKESQCQKRN